MSKLRINRTLGRSSTFLISEVSGPLDTAERFRMCSPSSLFAPIQSIGSCLQDYTDSQSGGPRSESIWITSELSKPVLQPAETLPINPSLKVEHGSRVCQCCQQTERVIDYQFIYRLLLTTWVIYSVEWMIEWTGREMKRSRPILRFYPNHLLRRTEENLENPQSGWSGAEACAMTVCGFGSVCWLVG